MFKVRTKHTNNRKATTREAAAYHLVQNRQAWRAQRESFINILQSDRAQSGSTGQDARTGVKVTDTSILEVARCL
jgi:hypothetical protein